MVAGWLPRPKIFLKAEVAGGWAGASMGPSRGSGARNSEAEAARATTSRPSRVSLVAASSREVSSFTLGSDSGSAGTGAGAATSASSDGLLSSTSGWS